MDAVGWQGRRAAFAQGGWVTGLRPGGSRTNSEIRQMKTSLIKVLIKIRDPISVQEPISASGGCARPHDYGAHCCAAHGGKDGDQDDHVLRFALRTQVQIK